MIFFLHLGYDDKFYPGIIKYYRQLEGVYNLFLAYQNNRNKPLQFLNGCKDVCILNQKRDLVSIVKKGDYDILEVHSLSYEYWDIIKSVPKDKTVIWQSYGYDIYTPGPFGIDYRLIQVDSLLPITRRGYNSSMPFKRAMKNRLARVILNFRWLRYGRKIVERVDFFQPVFHLEYELLKKLPYFKAKEYYPPSYNPRWQNFSDEPKQNAQGAIQICNSASEYGNHLDVWDKIKDFIPSNQELIIPLSYGQSHYACCVKNTILKDHHNSTILETFVQKADYYKIINRSSYFVHGAIRQHAMANIYNAIAEGRKVFLFEDSLIYRYLTYIGCVVYRIEDINENSFNFPLSKEEHLKNITALKNLIRTRREMGAIIFNKIKEL